MLTEKIHPLEPDMLELFAQKGKEGESDTPQPYNANGLKVRRIMQIIRDLARNSVEEIQATLMTGQRSTGGLKQQVKSIINKALRPLGFRIIGI